MAAESQAPYPVRILSCPCITHAQVVTSSRQHVVWYVQELREALRKSEEFQRLQRTWAEVLVRVGQ